MHINLEAADQNSIQAYSDEGIKVGSSTYQSSLIISTHEIISEWPISSIQELDEESLEPLLRYQPKIIIIGHKQQGKFAPQPTILALAKRRIGLETMSIGAACRTFNVLLNEQREVVIGLII
ncbi:hypothetical protein BN59_03535 [Legionella massiliensis]|uniref:Uncharacterized protein n=1 Tax=Legionella massiliensis TaxID=1034943 RepID=A0A078L1U7_9GAMM|nr:MTH938/NDUFAF3 family protein [Legionella massiliensis]CDZ79217.1 hypothetical protein BN59_03535 [Legionella massiliensis]CEE14955.1 hypothetical protein BN1094_03535 [Legionella massiliensis]